MSRIVLFVLSAVLAITYFSCTKSDTLIGPETFKDPFVSAAASFIRDSVSRSEFETLDLKDYSLLRRNDKEIIGVRFNVNGTKGKRFLVVGKTEKGLVGNWVDLSQLGVGEEKNGVLNTNSFSGKKKVSVSFKEGRLTKISSVIDGKHRTTLLRYDDNGKLLVTPIGERISGPDSEEDGWLREVVVVGYYYNTPINFHSLYYYFNSNPYYNYTYQTTDPYYGDGGGSGSSTVVELQAFEILSGPEIDLTKRFNCFNSVPTNASTSYSVTLYADIPDNNDPEQLVAGDGSPGHAFVTLTKTNGTSSVSQTFGFYPLKKGKSVGFHGVESKIVDNGGDEYNASITMTNVSLIDFNAAMNLALSNSTLLYDLNDYNCTDYAVGVFNQVMPFNNQLNVPVYITGFGVTYKTTPNKLYKTLKQMKQSGEFQGSIQVGTGNGTRSAGDCN
jgi:hypothetical protein